MTSKEESQSSRIDYRVIVNVQEWMVARDCGLSAVAFIVAFLQWTRFKRTGDGQLVMKNHLLQCIEERQTKKKPENSEKTSRKSSQHFPANRPCGLSSSI